MFVGSGFFSAYYDVTTHSFKKNWGTGQECLVSERRERSCVCVDFCWTDLIRFHSAITARKQARFLMLDKSGVSLKQTEWSTVGLYCLVFQFKIEFIGRGAYHSLNPHLCVDWLLIMDIYHCTLLHFNCFFHLFIINRMCLCSASTSPQDGDCNTQSFSSLHSNPQMFPEKYIYGLCQWL